MSTPDPTNKAPGGKVAGRSQTRLIVRSIIGVLFAIMLIELVAYGRLLLVHRQFMAEIQTSEGKDHRFTKAGVTKILGGREPDESKQVKAPVGMERYDLYRFWGLLKSRPLVVHYGVEAFNVEPEVLDVSTNIPDEYLAAK